MKTYTIKPTKYINKETNKNKNLKKNKYRCKSNKDNQNVYVIQYSPFFLKI